MTVSAPHHSLPLAINMNSPGSFVHWSIFDISVANLVLIAVMVVIFGLALLLPFPRGHRVEAGPAADGAGDGRWPGVGSRLMRRPPGCGRTGCGAARCGRCRRVNCCPISQPAYVASWVYVFGVASIAALGVAIVSGLAPGSGRPGLVALQPGRALFQQPARVERRAVHGAAGHPLVGQVLDGRLARPPGDDLDHRRGRVRVVGRGVLHRLPVAAELRLAVDLHQRQGRVQLRRGGRVLQRDELRPDADVAHRAAPDRAGRHRRRARAAGPGPRGLASDRRARRRGRGRAGGCAGAPSRPPTPRRGVARTGVTTS